MIPIAIDIACNAKTANIHFMFANTADVIAINAAAAIAMTCSDKNDNVDIHLMPEVTAAVDNDGVVADDARCDAADVIADIAINAFPGQRCH